jgi:predicted Ser/Thr protein kinase
LNQEKKSISVEELAMEPYRILLSYPKVNGERVTKLTRELMEAGVSKILFIGKTKLDGLNVLGKGCTAIVFAAETVYGKTAVKVLRVDANRKTLEDEAKFLKMVNAYNIGPKLYHTSRDFIIMEYANHLSKTIEENYGY